MHVRARFSPVRSFLGRPSSLLISFGVLIIIHAIAARHPPELFRDRSGPWIHEYWTPRTWRGYPERPVVYKVAQIHTAGGPVMVSDDVHADFESALRHASTQRDAFTEYAAYRRTDTYGLWFPSIRIQHWNVYRIQQDLSARGFSMSELAVGDPRIRLFAAHPQLPGRLPLRVTPHVGLFGDLIGLVASVMFLIGILSALARTLASLRAGWRSIPEGHCDACGYDLAGLPAPVCPECGMRMNSASHP